MLAFLLAGKRQLSQISFDLICQWHDTRAGFNTVILNEQVIMKALILTQFLWKKCMATFKGVDILVAGLAL